MDLKINIKEISFGADTAEDDMALGLPSYFQDTKSFEEFLSGKKYIIVGNRGSGKSAIFKKMQSSLPAGSIGIEITPDKCSYEQLSATQDMVNLGKATIGAFQAGWKFMALILVLKDIHKRGAHFKRGADAKIHQYLRDHHDNVQHDPITVLATYVLRIIDLLLNRGPLKLAGKPVELEKLYKLEELDFLMEDLRSAVITTPIYIFVDELDKGWDNSDVAKLFVAALLRAAEDLNRISKNIHFFVSIRRDIIENIPQQLVDLEKLRRYIQDLRWEKEEMFSMLVRRLKHFCKPLAKIQSEVAWDQVFEPTIYKKTNSFIYFLERSMMRPREIIQFCNLCIKQHRNEYDKIDYETAAKAEILHSANRLEDFSREYENQYPNIRNILDSFNGRGMVWEKSDLETHLLEFIIGNDKIFQNWAYRIDYDDLLHILFEIGFIQAYIAGSVRAGRKSGSGYYSRYDLVGVDLPTVKRFRLHPLFKAALNLKERSEVSEEG